MSKPGFSWWVAQRYLRPSRRDRFLSFITIVATIGVMLGTCALLISLSILEGFDRELRSTIVDVTGHIELTTRFGVDSIAASDALAASLPSQLPEISAVAPFVRREAIVRSDVGLEGVLLKAIDPARDVSRVRDFMVAGSFVADASSTGAELPSLLVGERLAERLGVVPGDTTVLFLADRDPSIEQAPTIEQFVMGGLYRSGMAEYDDVYVFTDLPTGRRLLGYAADEVNGFDILVNDPERAEETATGLNNLLGVPFSAVPIQDLFASIFAWIDLQRLMIPVIMIIIAIVATFNVVSTLLISVIEKVKSIATLATIGATGTGIGAIFVSKGFIVTLVGLVAGSILTLIFALLQQNFGLIRLEASIYVFDAVPIAIDPLHYLLVAVSTLALAVATTLLPAWIAARTKPIAILRLR